MKVLKIYLILFACLLLTPALTTATPATAQTDTVADTGTAKAKKGWWTIGAEVANNSSFFGRNTAKQYPYTAATITYVHNTGVWGSVTSYKLFETESSIDETDISVGYSFKVEDMMEANISYSHFMFGENTPLVKAVTSNALSARAAMDWGILYTGLTSSYIFGNNHDLFAVLENSRFVPLNPLWNGKHVIGIDPKVTVTAGTQRFYETHTTTTRNNSGSPLAGTPIGGILNPSGSNNSDNTTTTTREVNKFNVLNYELKLPVVIYLGKFELESAYRYSIPVNKLEGDEPKAMSFYSFNISYTF